MENSTLWCTFDIHLNQTFSASQYVTIEKREKEENEGIVAVVVVVVAVVVVVVVVVTDAQRLVN